MDIKHSLSALILQHPDVLFNMTSQFIQGHSICYKASLLEGFLTPISPAVYLQSGLETPPTAMKPDN